MTPPNLQDVDPAEYMIGKLAELDFTLAKHIHSFAMATDDPKEVVELAKAYRGVSRCVRQSVALHTQIKRARIDDERVNPPPPPRVDPLRVARRKAEVRRAACRVIWDETEVESEEEEALLEVLENTLKNRSKFRAFYEAPLDDEVMDVCAALGVPLEKAAAWRDLPDLSDERPDRAEGLFDGLFQNGNPGAMTNRPCEDARRAVPSHGAHPAVGAGPAVHNSA